MVDSAYDLLNPGFLNNWKVHLEKINRGKRGRPFRTPHAFIAFLAKISGMFGIPFGILETLAKTVFRVTGMPLPQYLSLSKWNRSINPVLVPGSGNVDGCRHSSGCHIQEDIR